MNQMKYTVLALFSCLLFLACQQQDKSYQPKSFEELTGHKVCLLEGSIQQDYANSYLKDKDIDFVYFPGATDCLLALNQGKADVFFAADLYAYNESFHRQHLKICHVIEEINAPVAFGIKKGRLDLVNDLNAFQDSLAQCGVKEELVSRWFNPENTNYHNCVKFPPTSGKPQGDGPVLKIGISGIKPPATLMIDNLWTGAEIEFLQRYAQSRGMEVQIDVYDFGSLIPALETDKVDIVASTLAINDERKQKIEFSDVFTSVKAAFITADPDFVQSQGFWSKLKESAYYSLVAENRWKLLVDGLWITLWIAICSLILGSVFGAGVCWLTMSKRKFFRWIGNSYVIILRNLPMLVLLMLMFYVFLAGLGLPTVVVAILAFALNSAAYISEIYRTGIESVDRGQTEAGLALGFTTWQTFWYIVAPQAARRALPVFKGQAVALLKGTSIVGYISIIDLTKASDLIRSASFEAFFPLLIVSIIYFILAWLFTWVLDLLFKRI